MIRIETKANDVNIDVECGDSPAEQGMLLYEGISSVIGLLGFAKTELPDSMMETFCEEIISAATEFKNGDSKTLQEYLDRYASMDFGNLF